MKSPSLPSTASIDEGSHHEHSEEVDRRCDGGDGEFAACGADGDSSKAGNASFPVTLRVGIVDGAGSPAEAQVEEFARQVGASSMVGSARAGLGAGGEDVVDVDQKVDEWL